MSETLNELMLSTQPAFQAMDTANGGILDFKQECMFARQQVTKNNFTQGVATQNPVSLKSAICNVAAIGVSLNPALAHAYLVPRDGGICLDISYRGLVKLATDSGAILWAKTELVYENDTFAWNGPNSAPDHNADVFGDRGELKGGYCLAKLPDSSVMVEIMTIVEMDQIQATSKAANGPWKTWPDEMRKKSVTKRASKSWPQTENRERIDRAISVLNEHEGLVEKETTEILYTEAQQAEYERCVLDGDFFNLAGMIKFLDADSQLQLRSLCVPEAEKGKKMAARKEFNESLEDGSMQIEASIDTIQELLESGDDAGVIEILESCSSWTFDHIRSKLSLPHQNAIKDLNEAA